MLFLKNLGGKRKFVNRPSLKKLICRTVLNAFVVRGGLKVLIKSKIIGQRKYKCIFEIKLWYKDLFSRAYKEHQKKLDDVDVVYLLNAHIGEAFLFLKYFYLKLDLRQKKKRKKTFILTNNRNHVAIAKSLSIDNIAFSDKFSASRYDSCFEYKGKEFVVIFNKAYYDKLDRELKQCAQHYFYSIEAFLATSAESFYAHSVRVPDSIREHAMRKAAKLGLNVLNFALVIPHANTSFDLDAKVVNQITEFLTSKGMNVLINSSERAYAQTENIFVSIQFSVLELFALASKAKEIVSVRCGLAEYLADSQRPMTLIYTDFRGDGYNAITQFQALNGFSLRRISSGYSMIREIAVSNFSIATLQGATKSAEGSERQ